VDDALHLLEIAQRFFGFVALFRGHSGHAGKIAEAPSLTSLF
jgi:hypothetical protein